MLERNTSVITTIALILLLAGGPGCAAVDDDESAGDAVAFERAAIAWMQENAVELKSVVAGTGFEDLEPVAEMVRDADVIGLGEATHGTREFFQFKHRMLEYLVEEHGFRVFGIEANFADCLAINDYVLSGNGDPEALIHAMNFWTWDTEEVLELVLWMRRYNARHEDKIYFHGYDAQYAPPALRRAIDFLAATGDKAASRFETALADYLQVDGDYETYSLKIYREPGDRKTARHARSVELLAYIDDNAERLATAGRESEYAVARAAAFSAERAFAAYLPGEDGEPASAIQSFNVRDRAMADLVLWGLDHYTDDAKMVLWAHNGHVQTVGFDWVDAKAQVMGMNLRDDLGEGYLSLGFGFGQGGLQARASSGNDDITVDIRPLQAFEVGPAPPGTIGGTMLAVGLEDFLIDLRDMSDERARRWFAVENPMRIAGGIFQVAPPEHWGKVSLSDSFDLFVFISETTRARPLKRTRDRFDLDVTW